MKHLVYLFTILIFCQQVFSQATYYTISGKVIDKTSRNPLAGASVFAQNTTFGIASDAEGNFKLKIPNGGYELIVTFTGYETENLRINQASADQNIVIELKKRERSLEEVSVVASNEVKDGWQKYGAFFTENFIGKTFFAQQTTIKNPEVLKFYYSKKRNRLKVLSGDPLLVTNNALGYIIKFAIDSFTYEYNTGVNQFIGYPLFEEMQGSEAQQLVWKQNRKKAYEGSQLHFMRSLYNRRLADEGFEVQLLVKYNNEENTLQLKNVYGALNYSKDDSTNTVEFKPNQPDLVIIYMLAKPEQGYFDYDPKAKKDYQVSTLTVAVGESIVIEQNGYYYDQADLTTNGYWAYKRVGDLLPYDYVPD